eukprot:7658740-Pyramimonas_sp.AAC.1
MDQYSWSANEYHRLKRARQLPRHLGALTLHEHTNSSALLRDPVLAGVPGVPVGALGALVGARALAGALALGGALSGVRSH